MCSQFPTTRSWSSIPAGSVARWWTYSFGESACIAVNLCREHGACIVFATVLDQWTLPEHQCEHALLRQAREREPLAQAFRRERLVSKSLVKVRSWHWADLIPSSAVAR